MLSARDAQSSTPSIPWLSIVRRLLGDLLFRLRGLGVDFGRRVFAFLPLAFAPIAQHSGRRPWSWRAEVFAFARRDFGLFAASLVGFRFAAGFALERGLPRRRGFGGSLAAFGCFRHGPCFYPASGHRLRPPLKGRRSPPIQARVLATGLPTIQCRPFEGAAQGEAAHRIILLDIAKDDARGLAVLAASAWQEPRRRRRHGRRGAGR